MEWHDWFAWYPVLTLENIWVWGSVVRRKQIPTFPKPYRGTPEIWFQRKYWYRVPEHSWF